MHTKAVKSCIVFRINMMKLKILFFLCLTTLLVSCGKDEPETLADLFDNHTWTSHYNGSDPDAADEIKITFKSNHQFSVKYFKNGKESSGYIYKHGTFSVNETKYRVNLSFDNNGHTSSMTIELTNPSGNNPLGYCLRGNGSPFRNRIFLP